MKTLDGWCQGDKAIPWSRSEARWVKGSYPRLEASETRCFGALLFVTTLDSSRMIGVHGTSLVNLVG